MGLNKRDADSLNLESGVFGSPVSLMEANIQYTGKLLTFRAICAQVMIPDAEAINNADANNTPESFYDAYAEA